jgi:UDP-GlcNAc:undecaprenyl-phosphate/decaprenyl-phosphate GlcNAc-1-phosphate transferase
MPPNTSNQSQAQRFLLQPHLRDLYAPFGPAYPVSRRFHAKFNMRTYLAAFLVALVVAAGLVPWVRRLALRLGVVASPGGRHVHGQYVPRLGGLAIAVATLCPLCTLFFVDSDVARIISPWHGHALTLICGSLFMCAIGVWDDVRGLRPRFKLLAQMCGAIFAYALGYRIEGFDIPFVGPTSVGVLSPFLTVLWIVGITNAVNLIDGLDGLAAGVVFFAATTNLIVGLLAWPYVGAVFVCLLMASLMGALLGFLWYNFNPARIFMGDSGSYFLGYTLALTSLLSPIQKASTAVSLVIPIIALGLPIFDTLLSVARRYVAHQPIFNADRGHIHHRLLDVGFTHRRAVVTLYGVTVVLAALAIVATLDRAWSSGLAVLGASAMLFGLVRFVSQFDRAQARRGHSAEPDPFANSLRVVVPQLLVELSDVSTLAALRLVIESELERLQCSSFLVLEHESSVLSVTTATANDTLPEVFMAADSALEIRVCCRTNRPLSANARLLLQLVADGVSATLKRLAEIKGQASAPNSRSTRDSHS